MKRRVSAVVASCIIIGVVIFLRWKSTNVPDPASHPEPAVKAASPVTRAVMQSELPVPLVATDVKVLPVMELQASDSSDPGPAEVIEAAHPAGARYQYDRLVGEWVALLGRIHDAPAEIKSALKDQFRQEHALAIQAVEAASSGRISFADIGGNGYPAAIQPRMASIDRSSGASRAGSTGSGDAIISKDRIGRSGSGVDAK